MSLGCQLHLHHDSIDRRQQVSTKLDGNHALQDEEHNGRYTPLSFPLHQHACPSRLIRVGYVAQSSCEPLFSSDPQNTWPKAAGNSTAPIGQRPTSHFHTRTATLVPTLRHINLVHAIPSYEYFSKIYILILSHSITLGLNSSHLTVFLSSPHYACSTHHIRLVC